MSQYEQNESSDVKSLEANDYLAIGCIGFFLLLIGIGILVYANISSIQRLKYRSTGIFSSGQNLRFDPRKFHEPTPTTGIVKEQSANAKIALRSE